MIQLDVPEVPLDEVLRHLDPRKSRHESAAFMVAQCNQSPGSLSLCWLETHKLEEKNFAQHAADYIELNDETRGGLIRRAHELGGCLIEMHSHLGHWPAAFSEFDLIGLAETVPHMIWRLHNRPYVALVVASSGFDALVWERPDNPMQLDQIVSGSRVFRPTNLSLGGVR